MQYAKALGAVAAVGAVGVFLLKLLVAAFAPMVMSFLMKTLMIGLAVAAAFFLYRMFRRRRDEMEV
ncbi:MAG: hypothetical protein F4087_15890 [Gemmatimonadetes bacterium]|nr:hypothetical protein [Gemmatimonadota bacterium]MDE2679694.1 hypothetical protein [Gemmatimonadota bacterium]MXX36129.1 hypothetical protein [Gemmatimonadota bacterium]MYA11069.1 hypothetical protein [Gemmatimonadota bacterium]MYD12238.1 hypothetical protein [Gemmatimonadota bacterium]